MDLDNKFITVMFGVLSAQTPATSFPESKGRNGLVKTTGVEIYTNEEDRLVRVSPITTRDKVSDACYVEVPFDKQALQELARQFQLLSELAPGTGTT